jgi:hypothetical protein
VERWKDGGGEIDSIVGVSVRSERRGSRWSKTDVLFNWLLIPHTTSALYSILQVLATTCAVFI